MDADAVIRRVEAKRLGQGHLCEGFVEASAGREEFGEGTVDAGGWSDRERPLELPFRARPIPLEGAQRGCQRGVRRGQIGVVTQGILQMSSRKR
jgi:hypothetical protein